MGESTCSADVVVRHDPVGEALPLVLDSPHSGERYPEDFDHRPSRATVRLAEDTHVARLWSAAPRVGATLIEAAFPRAYIDVNRGLGDIDPQLLAEPWPETLAPSRKTAQGIGLVWRLARDGTPMYARKLAVAELSHRIDRYWRPYHRVLQGVLDERHAAFGGVWHVNCHSMPAVGDARADDPGRSRADFVLGDRDGSTCAPEFIQFIAQRVSSMGYAVALNDPYKGVEILRRYGAPSHNRHSVQIEIKRALYMDEASLEPHAGYRKLERDLGALCAALAAFVREATYPRP